jgi:hypothetical protein
VADLAVIDAEAPDASVIAKLKEVLAMAERERLSSVALVVVHPDGRPQFFWSEAPSMGLLIGAASRLHAALVRDVDD